MVGWLKKRYEECPRCHSPQVRVPWEPARARGRRRLGLTLLALWSTLAAWVAVGVAVGSIWPWVGGLAVYAAVTGLGLWAATRSLRRFQCVECGHHWSLAPGPSPSGDGQG